MKKLTFICFSLCVSSLSARIDPYIPINAAQEKTRIVLKQMFVTYNWIDTIYATRERYYLSGISLDYVRQQKALCKHHKEGQALIEKLESILEKLHVMDLSQKEFEKLQCAAQQFIQSPLFATKPAAVVT